jgi:cytochrome P450
VYNLFLHPLKDYPGPRFAAFSRLPYVYAVITGRAHYWTKDIHDRYGDVVRVAPNELSFINGKAWNDVYGHRVRGKPSINKHLEYYPLPFSPNLAILTADDVNHGRIRKIFSNAFSERSLKAQEMLFQTYVNLLIEKLSGKVQADPNAKFNMVDMYNFTSK